MLPGNTQRGGEGGGRRGGEDGGERGGGGDDRITGLISGGAPENNLQTWSRHLDAPGRRQACVLDDVDTKQLEPEQKHFTLIYSDQEVKEMPSRGAPAWLLCFSHRIFNRVLHATRSDQKPAVSARGTEQEHQCSCRLFDSWPCSPSFLKHPQNMEVVHLHTTEPVHSGSFQTKNRRSPLLRQHPGVGGVFMSLFVLLLRSSTKDKTDFFFKYMTWNVVLYYHRKVKTCLQNIRSPMRSFTQTPTPGSDYGLTAAQTVCSSFT